MNLYTKAGWLDIPHIAEVADKNNISFIVIIGKRQVGKTYGVLSYMLDSDKRFVLLRGMRTELETLERGVASPFESIKDYAGRILLEKDSEYTAQIVRLDTDDEGNETRTIIGMGAALANVARVRGLNGRPYSDIVYDEFIPESHLLKVRHGDDAFNNMYTTFAGNRELEGEKPLRVWLLANSNNLDNDILKALNITDVVERMSLRDEESRIIKDRGIMILLPDSKQITEKRKKTALYRAVGGDSKFAKMAYENEFAYNDYSDVAQLPLAEYKPLIALPRCIIHLHKNDKRIYITGRYKCPPPKYRYNDTDYGRRVFQKDFPELRAAYMRGRIYFENMTIKNYFLDFLDLI